MKSMKEVGKCLGYHGRILLNGMIKVLYGAAAAGLMGLAVFGFAMIPGEGGYTAVCNFIGSAATLVVAVNATYAIGCSRKRR